jgi:hypothetical protein
MARHPPLLGAVRAKEADHWDKVIDDCFACDEEYPHFADVERHETEDTEPESEPSRKLLSAEVGATTLPVDHRKALHLQTGRTPADRSERAKRAWETRHAKYGSGQDQEPRPTGPEATVQGPSGAPARAHVLRALKEVGLEAALNADGSRLREEFSDLIAKVPVGHDAFRESWQNTLRDLGASETPYEDLTARPGIHGAMGDPKDGVRILEKALHDYDGQSSKVKDAVRATIAVDSLKDIKTVVDTIKKHYTVVRESDRFSKPVLGGYRDYLINVKLPNGLIGEIQLHGKPMLEAKEKRGGHKIYEQIRTLVNEKTSASAKALGHALLRSAALYGPAYRRMR